MHCHKLRQSTQRGRGGFPGDVRNFISVSQTESSILKPYLPANARVFLLSNPVGLEKTAPANLTKNSLFIGLGRLSPEKGPLLLAAAAQQAGVHAVWVGDGDMRGELTQRFPSLQVTGWLSHREASGYLRAARALVFSSLSYETQGLAVLESAAVGVPAIVPDTCAAREFVTDGQTGLWFTGGDVDDLARKIRALQDTNLAVHLGAEAYQRYWKNPPTTERHIEELVRIYAQILSSHTAQLKDQARSADE